MARLFQHFIEQERTCSYLPAQRAQLEYRIMTGIEPREMESLLSRGFRRFGPAVFRPACRACRECVSLRVDVENFVPTQSQRRAQKRCSRFIMREAHLTSDAEHLSLHQAWHDNRSQTRSWDNFSLSREEYETEFAFRAPTGREWQWFEGEKLVAVSLVDVTENAVSAAYFYYSPHIAKLSPGVANVLKLIEFARATGRQHVYLGYRVLACDSLKYKASFGPHELLEGRPKDNELPNWVSVRQILR